MCVYNANYLMTIELIIIHLLVSMRAMADIAKRSFQSIIHSIIDTQDSRYSIVIADKWHA